MFKENAVSKMSFALLAFCSFALQAAAQSGEPARIKKRNGEEIRGIVSGEYIIMKAEPLKAGDFYVTPYYVIEGGTITAIDEDGVHVRYTRRAGSSFYEIEVVTLQAMSRDSLLDDIDVLENGIIDYKCLPSWAYSKKTGNLRFEGGALFRHHDLATIREENGNIAIEHSKPILRSRYRPPVSLQFSLLGEFREVLYCKTGEIIPALDVVTKDSTGKSVHITVPVSEIVDFKSGQKQ